MKKQRFKFMLLCLTAFLIVSSCGENKQDEKITLLEQELKETKEQQLKDKISDLEKENRELANQKKEPIKSSTSTKTKSKKRLAVINDPDGYTNVRSGMSTKTEIIDRLFEGEHYEVYPTSSSNWWRVNTQSNVLGYVHKSRIRIID